MTPRTVREQGLLAPHGDLHLVHRETLHPATVLPGVPGTWSPRVGGPGAHVDLADAESLLVDGRREHASGLDVRPGQAIAVDDRISVAIVPEPDGQVWLQVFDADAPNARAFDGIESFPENPAWRLPARFVADEDTTVFRRTGDGDREFTMSTPGHLEITVDGAVHRLTVGTFGPSFVVGFRDEVSDEHSAGAGRLLWLPGRPAEFHEIDFNGAILPPCAINSLVSCPVPPSGNRIPAAVTAGERRVRWVEPVATSTASGRADGRALGPQASVWSF